jgi:hypothetical protein
MIGNKVKDKDLDPYSHGRVLSIRPVIVSYGSLNVRYTNEQAKKYIEGWSKKGRGKKTQIR